MIAREPPQYLQVVWSTIGKALQRGQRYEDRPPEWPFRLEGDGKYHEPPLAKSGFCDAGEMDDGGLQAEHSMPTWQHGRGKDGTVQPGSKTFDHVRALTLRERPCSVLFALCLAYRHFKSTTLMLTRPAPTLAAHEGGEHDWRKFVFGSCPQ